MTEQENEMNWFEPPTTQEFIDEVEDKPTAPKNLTILDVLRLELQRHMQIALNYRQKIAEAKTDVKKKYYRKKLKKNNVAALKVLTAIERVTKQKLTNEPKEAVE